MAHQRIDLYLGGVFPQDETDSLQQGGLAVVTIAKKTEDNLLGHVTCEAVAKDLL
jgi:hypothetical protein